MSKYKLFDNLRRSTTPIFTALLLILSPLFETKTGWVMAVTAVLSVMTAGVFSAARAFIRNGTPMLSRRFYSDTFPVAKADLALSLLWLMLLIQNAFTCLTAIITALSRLISKKNLLQWTVASDSEKSAKSTVWLKGFSSFCDRGCGNGANREHACCVFGNSVYYIAFDI
ncbi:MAG: hypothetical protein ACOX45_01795 [Acutalibacteraceae bacterium]